MSNRNYNIPQAAIKFSNIVFLLNILFFILIIIYSAYRIFNPIYVNNTGDAEITIFYIYSMIFAFIFAFLLIFGLIKLNNNIKINLSIIFFH